jgi:hypothetical protein
MRAAKSATSAASSERLAKDATGRSAASAFFRFRDGCFGLGGAASGQVVHVVDSRKLQALAGAIVVYGALRIGINL